METPQNGQAQNQNQQLADYGTIIVDLNKNIDGLKQQITLSNTPVYQKYRETLIARYDEQTSLMKANAALYNWQNHASEVMMWIVVLVVVAGVSFSGFQLYHAARLGQYTDGTFEISAPSM